MDPEAAEVREKEEEQWEGEDEKEKEKEKENEADMEEQERINTLLQRKKLLKELGVVEQIQQLLQGRREGGGVPLHVRGVCKQQQSEQVHESLEETKVGARCSYLLSLHQINRWLCL